MRVWAIALAAWWVGSAGVANADEMRAKQNYVRLCAACHGFNGMSTMPDAPHLRLNQGLLQPDMQLMNKLKMGWARHMPLIGQIQDQEILELVLYTRTLR